MSMNPTNVVFTSFPIGQNSSKVSCMFAIKPFIQIMIHLLVALLIVINNLKFIFIIPINKNIIQIKSLDGGLVVKGLGKILEVFKPPYH